MDVSTVVLATHDHWVGHAGGWWPIFPLFWFLLIIGVILLFRRGCARGYHSGRSGESALGERFARGEIDEREYRDRLEVLRNSRKS